MALASFASSEDGKTYAMVCERWGVDPAAFLEDDDVLAYNLRAALAVSLHEPEEVDEAARHRTLIEQARRSGAELRHG
jgi:N-acyl-D-aspartate/D-glutamate deacylase